MAVGRAVKSAVNSKKSSCVATVSIFLATVLTCLKARASLLPDGAAMLPRERGFDFRQRLGSHFDEQLETVAAFCGAALAPILAIR